MRITDTEIHEAGHAVVAAYLRVPFHRAVTTPDGGYVSGPRTVPNHRLLKIAIVSLAGRTAVDSSGLKWNGPIPEEGYKHDEEQVRHIAEHCNIPPADFAIWRQAMLAKARAIVTIPYVAETITVVACLLAMEAVFKKSLPAKEVREALRYFKAAAGK